MTTIRTGLLAALLAGCLLLTACAGEDTAADDTAPDTADTADSATEDADASADADTAAYPVTVTSCGEEVVVEDRPERVLTSEGSQSEVFAALGLEDLIVAQAWNFEALVRPEHEAVVAALEEEAFAGDDYPSREQVVAFEPDFIFAGQGFFEEVAPPEDLAAGGVGYSPADQCTEQEGDTFEGQLTDIENLGRIFGVEDRAAELVAELRGDFEELTTALADVDPVDVLWVDYVYDDGSYWLSVDPFYQETVGLGGGDLLLPGVNQPNEEQIVAAQPDVLFITDIFGRTGYETTPQERADYIFERMTTAPATVEETWAPMPITPRNAMGYIDQIRAVAEVLHPDAL